MYFSNKYIKIQNFSKNPKITLRKLCEHFKWSGPVGFRKAGFSGFWVIFAPVLPRFRLVRRPPRPPKQIFLIASDPGPTPTPLWPRGNARGGRGRWVSATTKNTKNRSFRARKTYSYTAPVSRNGIIPFFSPSWGPRSPTLPPTAPRWTVGVARAGGFAGSTDLAARPRNGTPKPPPKHRKY